MKSKSLILLVIIGLLVNMSGIVSANGDDDHMGGDHMMDWDWFGIPYMWFWMIGIWLVLMVIAFLVYKDAEKREMNGLVWFILVILPWVGILFLIIYLIIREDKTPHDTHHKSANAILDERYAKGEITKQEYQQMKKDIEERG